MMTLDQFRKEMLAAGYDEVLERVWPPGSTAPDHSHPFEADAIVVQGEMWLSEGGGVERRLVPGERFHLTKDLPHAERYGPEGATYWVARKAG